MRPPLGVIGLLSVAVLGRREALLIDFELNVVLRIEVIDYPADLRRTPEYSALPTGTDREGESACGRRDLIKNEIASLACVPNVFRFPRFIPFFGFHGG